MPEATATPKPAAAAEVEVPVAATPKLGATDAFIPKPAAGVDTGALDIAKKSDPMAEAALINGGKEPEEKKPAVKAKTSLFELVTGTGKAAIDRVTGGQRHEVAAPSIRDSGEPKAERIISPSGGARAVGGQAQPQAMPQPTPRSSGDRKSRISCSPPMTTNSFWRFRHFSGARQIDKAN